MLIQTYQPEHHVFRAVQAHDYEGFYERELEQRRQAGYPPFTRLALVRLTGVQEEAVGREAQNLAGALKKSLAKDAALAAHVRVLGPAPAGLARLKGRFRWQLLLKSYGRPALEQTLAQVRNLWRPPNRDRLSLTLDVDPGHLF